MAIYINGKKVAGRGVSGKSPYQVALEGGYAGTEAEFNAQLVAIGEASRGFQELSAQVNNAKADIEAAVQTASNATSQALANIQAAKGEIDVAVGNAKSEINTAVNTGKSDLQDAVDDAKDTIDTKVENALAQIPDAENLATKVWVNEQLANVSVDLTGYATETWVNNKGYATQSSVDAALATLQTDIFLSGPSAPDSGYSGDEATKRRKLLWIDSNSTTGGLKYYDGSSWVHVPVAWQ